MELAILAAIATGLIWGINPASYTEAARRSGSLRANFWRAIGASLFLLPLNSILGTFSIPSIYVIGLIASAAFFSSGLGSFAFLKGIAMIGPGRATSIGSTYVVWTALLSSIVLGELVTPLILVGALLSVSGIWLLSYERGRWDVRGVAWSLTASFSWTLSPIVAKIALEYVNALNMSMWNSLISMMAYGILVIPNLTGPGMGKALFGGVMGVGVALSLYYYAIAEIGVTIPTLAISIGPPASQFTSWLVGERVTKRDLAGSLLVVLGLVLSIIGR